MSAEIDYLKSVRDDDIKPTLQAYKTLYYSINQSKRFNPDSYETHMLMKKIAHYTADLELINGMIDNARNDLATYIDQKAKTWEKIRKNRQKGKIDQK